MEFIPHITPPAEQSTKDPLYFVVKNQDILVTRNGDTCRIPSIADLADSDSDLGRARFIGTWNDHFCYAIEFQDDFPIIEPLHVVPWRDAFSQLSSGEIQAISLAKQILTWDNNFRFCGRCGKPTTELENERAKVCTSCGLTNYPRLSPSVIFSVIKDEHILLARSGRFPKGMYSVLAGFVEPGETLEECIRREVAEEVGIEVKNIQYFGSQNWPFPHSLMIAFTADYSSGEINIDNDEIVDAAWFTVQDLPKLPGSYSIARELIDHFCSSAVPENEFNR